VRLLEPEQIAVGHAQEILAVEALVGQQGLGVDPGDTVALLVQPRHLALQSVLAHVRQLAVKVVLAGLRGEEGLSREVALHEAVRRRLPIQAGLGRRPHGRGFCLIGLITAVQGNQQRQRQRRVQSRRQDHVTPFLVVRYIVRIVSRSPSTAIMVTGS